MRPIRLSRITEAAAFLMVNLGLRIVPSWAWGWGYRSPDDVYRVPRRGGSSTALSRGDGQSALELGHPEWRRCNNCGSVYPRTSDYWHKNGDGRGGLHSLCVYCRREAERVRYKNKPQVF